MTVPEDQATPGDDWTPAMIEEFRRRFDEVMRSGQYEPTRIRWRGPEQEVQAMATHLVPEQSSSDPMHTLTRDCPCKPEVDGQGRIVHRDLAPAAPAAEPV